MNGLIADVGLQPWKPLLTALVLPPVPLLVLLVAGTGLVAWRRSAGWLVVALAAAALWLASSAAVGEWLMRSLLQPPPALGSDAIAELRRDVARKRPTAIVVLGGGREARAPEYGLSSLRWPSLERLRYGLWLSRETGAPVGFSGGVGHAEREGAPEAEIAARIAAREFGRPLRWTESESRDTRENALHMMAILKNDGIARIVLVTHAWHMPRAQRAFEEAARLAGLDVKVVPAPIGWAPRIERPALRWMPSHEGFMLVRQSLREGFALLAGA